MKHLDQWATKSTTESAHYDPAEDIQKYTFEVAEKLLLGRSTGDVDGGLLDTFNIWLQGYEGLVPFDVPWTAHGKAMRARKVLMEEYRKIIQEKRASMSDGKEDRDMLARVMNSKDEHGERASEEQLMDFCITMMFAGHDTTKASIQTMMHLLAAEPHSEKELAEEVGTLWDGTSPITWEMVDALEHGKCGRFIGEQLRIMPQVPGCYRVVTEDMKVNGYTIPKGWKIMTSPAANQMMLEGNKQTVDLTIDHSKYKESEYHPFGGGGRGCVGYRFARAELLIWMMCLFKHYKVDVDTTKTVIKMMPFLYASVKVTFRRQEVKQG
jgi:cytochrome P450